MKHTVTRKMLSRLKPLKLSMAESFGQSKVIFYNQRYIGTLGDISISMSKDKSACAANLSALVAAALSRKAVDNYEVELPKGKRSVLYIDTAHTRPDCLEILRSALRQAGLSVDEDHDDLIHFYTLRNSTFANRLALIESAIRESANFGLVIIDNLYDLVYDPNNVAEGYNVVQRLMAWSDIYNVHIHCVVQQNKTNDEIRGHLGTELLYKSETVMTLTPGETPTTPQASIVTRCS